MNAAAGKPFADRERERERLRAAALAEYGILDTDPELDFDDLVRVAALICAVPIAAVSFTDTDRQWFKSETGLGVREAPRPVAFCNWAVDSGQDVFVIEDTVADERFRSNPLVVDDPRVRFYAGAIIRADDDVNIGTVCVMDRTPRQLTDEQLAGLNALARQARTLLDARHRLVEVALAARQRETALEQATAAAGRFQVAFSNAPTGMILFSVSGRIVEVNAAFAQIIGSTDRGQLVGQDFRDITVAEDVQSDLDNAGQMLTGGTDVVVREKRYRHAAGTEVPALVTTSLVRDDLGKPINWLCQVESIAERRLAEQALLETQSASDAIITTDAAGVVTAWNTGAERLFGRPRSSVIGGPATVIIPDRFHPQLRDRLAEAASGSGAALVGRTIEWSAVRADGTEFPVEQVITSWERQGAVHFTSIIRDVSERLAMHTEMLRRASTDPLTGVGNRSWLTGQLERALGTEACAPVSVLVVDLDGFAAVNASLGPTIGDRLLIDVARVLRGILRDDDHLARLGSDEFAILLPRTTPTEARRIAQQLAAQLAEHAQLPTGRLALSSCIGIAASRGLISVSRRRSTANRLLRNAALARNEATRRGPGSIGLYRSELVSSARRRLTLHTELSNALQAERLQLAFQPQLDLTSGRICAVEALCRWTHPELGVITPSEFVPLAESTGLMPELGRWVLARACREAATWTNGPFGPVSLSVNVSGVQLAVGDVVPTVREALRESGLPAQLLTVEVTESVLVDDVAAAARQLAALRQLGVRVAIDDFGTGYSSLSWLTRLPVDELKVDRSFVAPLPQDGSALRVVRAVLGLAESLGLSTVAEGIETDGQAQLLRELGCEIGQGYLFARPQSAEGVRQLLLPLGVPDPRRGSENALPVPSTR